MFNPSFTTYNNPSFGYYRMDGQNGSHIPLMLPNHHQYQYGYQYPVTPQYVAQQTTASLPKRKKAITAQQTNYIATKHMVSPSPLPESFATRKFAKYDLMEYWISNEILTSDSEESDPESDRQMAELLVLGFLRRHNVMIQSDSYSVLTVTLSLYGQITQKSEIERMIEADFHFLSSYKMDLPIAGCSPSSSSAQSAISPEISPRFSPNGSPEVTSFYGAMDMEHMEPQYMSSQLPSPPFLYNANSKDMTPLSSVTATPCHRLLSFRPGLSSKTTPSATPTPRSARPSAFNFSAATEQLRAISNHQNATKQAKKCQKASSSRSPSSGMSANREYHGLSLPRLLKKNLSIRDLIDNNLLHRLLKDKNGSKYLQEKLKKKNASDRSKCRKLVALMINYLLKKNESILGMAKDVYDNYLVQLLFQFGGQQSHSQMLSNFVINSMLDLSQNKYGCRVVQEIIKSLSPDMAVQCVEALRDQCIAKDRAHSRFSQQSELQKLLKCCNGNRVIQAMIELKLPYNHCKFVGDELESKLAEYSEDRNACRVVQSFIKIYGDKLSVCKLLINDQHLKLSQKVHGNYVIQCIIAKNEWYSALDDIANFRSKLIHDVFSWRHLSYLAVHKQASNVIEECIRCAQPHQIEHLMHALCQKQGSLLKKFMKHKYGNFVPKTLFLHLNDTQKQSIVNVIHKNVTDLHRYQYAQYKHCSELIEECRKIKQNMDGVQVRDRSGHQVRAQRFSKN